MSAPLNIVMASQVWCSAMPKGCNKHVLQCLIQHMNNATGLSWPSIPRVALMCGMSERTVQCHIRALLAAGILRARLRTGRTTHYTIHIGALVPLVFPTTTVVLDAGDANAEEPVDNSAIPAQAVDNSGPPPAGLVPELQESAPQVQVFAPEPAENDTKPVEICTLTKDLTSKNSEGTQVPAPALPAASVVFENIDTQTVEAFFANRAAKKYGQLKAADLETLQAEAYTAGLSMLQVLTICKAKSWASFKAEWVSEGLRKTVAHLAPASAAPAAAPAAPPPAPLTAQEIASRLAARDAALAALKAKDSPAPAPSVQPAKPAAPAASDAPAMPSGASDISIAPNAPPQVVKAAQVVNAYRRGQHVNRFTLESACHELKISPHGLRRTAPAPVTNHAMH